MRTFQARRLAQSLEQEQAEAGPTTFLYRHYDKKGVLLYAGISLSVVNRLSQHKNGSAWFRDIAKVEIESCATREEALEKERRAIIEEKPKHNKTKAACTRIYVEPIMPPEISRVDLTKRIVQYNASYDLNDAASALGVSQATIKRWIEEKKLGYIVVGHRTGKWGVREKRRITGWQLIDFIEHLENETMKKGNGGPK